MASYTNIIEVIDICSDSGTDSDVQKEVKKEVDGFFQSGDEGAEVVKVEPADELQQLKEIDAACQKDRKQKKELMSVKKAEAAKDKEAKEKVAKAKSAKVKEAKEKAAKAKAAKKAKAKTAKVKKAKAKANKDAANKAKTKTKVFCTNFCVFSVV